MILKEKEESKMNEKERTRTVFSILLSKFIYNT